MERNYMRSMVVFGVFAAVMLQCAAAQTTYVVGDNLGWTIPQNGAQAYVSWASNKTFMVGDVLIFNFVTNAHDVLQVTKDSYDACTSTNPIGSSITTGPANITLTSAGDHYYICTYGRHCQSGQKLTITVSASGTPTTTSPPSTTNPPPPSTPSPTSSTTPEACAPEPSTTTPTTSGPTTSTTTPPANGPSPPIMESIVCACSFCWGFSHHFEHCRGSLVFLDTSRYILGGIWIVFVMFLCFLSINIDVVDL